MRKRAGRHGICCVHPAVGFARVLVLGVGQAPLTTVATEEQPAIDLGPVLVHGRAARRLGGDAWPGREEEDEAAAETWQEAEDEEEEQEGEDEEDPSDATSHVYKVHLGLAALLRRHPDAAWFGIVKDDVFLDDAFLVDFLQGLRLDGALGQYLHRDA